MVHHSGWTKKKLQSTCQSQSCTRKRVIVTIWWSAVSLIYYSFVNHHIWEVCSANWWDTPKTAILATSIGQKNGPNSSPQQRPAACHTTNASKVAWIGLQSFASYPIFRLPLTNWLPLIQASRHLFAGKMLPQPAGRRKSFPRVRWIPKHRFLCYRNKRTYFSLAKMYWFLLITFQCNGSYFD